MAAYIHHVELEIGTNDLDDEGRKDKSPIARIGPHERQQKVCDKVRDSTDPVEDRIVDPVEENPRHDVPGQSGDGLRQQADADLEGVEALHLLEEQRQPEGRRVESHDTEHERSDEL